MKSTRVSPIAVLALSLAAVILVLTVMLFTSAVPAMSSLSALTTLPDIPLPSSPSPCSPSPGLSEPAPVTAHPDSSNASSAPGGGTLSYETDGISAPILPDPLSSLSLHPIDIPPLTPPPAPLRREIARLVSAHASNPAVRPGARVVLFRAIGNDLPPRHAVGQTVSNVAFILSHEPRHAGLDARWYINQVLNDSALLHIVRLLVAHNATFTHRAFDARRFLADTDYDVRPHSSTGDPLRSGVFGDEAYPPMRRGLIWDRTFDSRNRAVIRNNAARNEMLSLALEAGAEYALPWDGNCFLNAAAWHNLSSSLFRYHSSSAAAHEAVAEKYFYVPMARVTDNSLLQRGDFVPQDVTEEPQLVFRRDSGERFDEGLPYGRRPKVDLLWRLRIAGFWDGFGGRRDWKLSADVDVGRSVAPVGWTARLSSGMPHLEKPRMGTARGVSRTDGVERIVAAAGLQAAEQLLGYSVEGSTMLYGRACLEGIANGYNEEEEEEKKEITLAKGLLTILRYYRGERGMTATMKGASNNGVGQNEGLTVELGGIAFRERANIAVHEIFQWVFQTQNVTKRKQATCALQSAFETNVSHLAANVSQHAVSVCALLDAARMARWPLGSKSSTLSLIQSPSDPLLNTSVEWARTLAEELEKGEREAYYSSAIADEDEEEGEKGMGERRMKMKLEKEEEKKRRMPLYYRTGADGIAFEVAAACAHAYVGRDHFERTLRRTALARQRLTQYVKHSNRNESEKVAIMDARTMGLWMTHAAVARRIGVDVWSYDGTPAVGPYKGSRGKGWLRALLSDRMGAQTEDENEKVKERAWNVWIKWTGRCVDANGEGPSSLKGGSGGIMNNGSGAAGAQPEGVALAAEEMVEMEEMGRKVGLAPFLSLAAIDCSWML